MTPELQSAFDRAADLLSESRSILFITGAGISADSGLPVYRGVGGLYDDTETEDGVRIEDALSASMFREFPDISWKYLRQLGNAVAAHQCNDAHRILAAFEHLAGHRVWTLTQNVDGYHFHAGARNVIEIHGSVWRMRCEGCAFQLAVDAMPAGSELPRCRVCSQTLRPDVVLFDEMLPAAALRCLERQLQHGFDLFVSIGTSSRFPYIVQPVLHAVRRGIPAIEINPAASTAISSAVDVHVRCNAAPAMREIAARIGLDWEAMKPASQVG
jgi:NAD-dependent deacetylase